MNKLFVISGPSGVGKGTLVKRILAADRDVALSVSCTTRRPRVGEQHGREYFFITREEFESHIRAGDFIEYNEHFGNLYGTPRTFVEEQLARHSVILEIEVNGGLRCRDLMPEKTVLIFIAPPSPEELEERLAHRETETAEQRAERLGRVRYENEQKKKYDYVVVNDDLNRAAEELCSIIRKETNRN